MAESKKGSDKNLTKDQMIEKLSKIVAEKKAEITKIEKSAWNTPCSLKLTEGSSAINLHTVKDVTQLAILAGHLILNERAFSEGAKALGLSGVVFKHQGHTLSAWLEDFQTEIGKIQIADKRAKLAEMEKQLESLESKESKEAKLIAELEKNLKDM